MADWAIEQQRGLRPYLIGGLVSLAVTVIGGVGVYLLTVSRETASVEDLVYLVSAPARFATGEREVRIQTVAIYNNGTAPARDVRASIVMPGTPVVLGRDIRFSAGEAANVSVDTTKPESVTLRVPVLTPNENISVSYLVQGGASTEPEVSVKSASTTGSRSSPQVVVAQPLAPWRMTTLSVLLLVQGLLLGFILKIRRAGWSAKRNNTGFLLLHAGLSEDAVRVFEAAVLVGNADAYLLSNYAVAKAVTGNRDQALDLLGAASVLATNSSHKGQIEFCRALILLWEGRDLISASKAMDLALQHDSNIHRYFRFSKLIQQLRLQSAAHLAAIEAMSKRA